jgi:sigma-B regulation protein RsbU (phosphoserine phosphatase)
MMLSDRAVMLCVGDVVGKGMPAALLTASLHAAVKALASDTVSPAALCSNVNRLIAASTSPGVFITFFYALLDMTSRELSYCNAGHNAPILVRGDSEAVVRLEAGGPVLGVFPDCEFGQETITLNIGDRLLLFTDGVTEVRNADGEEFGDDRAIAVIRTNPDAASIQRSVLDEVTRFSGGPFHDDVTVLALNVAPQ